MTQIPLVLYLHKQGYGVLTKEEYEYIEARLGHPISRNPPLNLAKCKEFEYPIFTISKAPPNRIGEQWVLAKYKNDYYLAE